MAKSTNEKIEGILRKAAREVVRKMMAPERFIDGALEQTTTGEQEDARRWRGATIYCGRCECVISGLLRFENHDCKSKSKGKTDVPGLRRRKDLRRKRSVRNKR